MDRRQEILRAAETLFAAHGYGSTRVAEIAQVAGLSPGAGGLYRHFSSKRELLDAVIDLALERLQATLRHRAAFEALDLPLQEKLEQIGAMLLARGRESRDLLIIMDRDLPRFPELLERVRRELLKPAMSSLESWLELQVSESRREGFDAAALAQVAWDGIARRVTTSEADSGLSDARFIEAWTLALCGALELADQGRAKSPGRAKSQGRGQGRGKGNGK